MEGEVGEIGAGAYIPFAARRHFEAEQIGQEFGVRKVSLCCSVQTILQDVCGVTQAELVKVVARLFEGDHGATSPSKAA